MPTLVISGRHDVAATPEDGRDLQAGIPNARYVELDASYLSNWERPEEFNRTVVDFLMESALTA
jgi:3-oxoadipate enol-lactonase